MIGMIDWTTMKEKFDVAYDVKILPKTDEDPIRSLQDWVFPAVDNGGTWGCKEYLHAHDGPAGDWTHEHSHKWFEYVKDYRVAVQAGGLFGMYARLLSDRFTTVYTFEPNPESFHCLVRNCQKDNIVKMQAALGSRLGQCSLAGVPADMGLTKIATQNGSIPVLTIDILQLQHLDLLALDCEGFEEHILQGGISTIQRCKPVITCESSDSYGRMWELLGYKKVSQSRSDGVYIPI